MMVKDGDGREWDVAFETAQAQSFFRETIALIFDRKVEALIVQNDLPPSSLTAPA